MVGGGVEGDRLDAARLLGQRQRGRGDATGGQRAGRRQTPELDLKENVDSSVIQLYHTMKSASLYGF